MGKLLLAVVLLVGGWLLLRRVASGRRGGGLTPRLDEAEARAVLGVGAGADAEAIRAAHRRLLQAVHPDHGGSDDLTRRINAARDVLLGR